MSYSQYDEEQAILSAVGHIQNGKFLDIGAYHPTVFSNTRALYERGWSGVMLEPSPEPFLSLLKEYGKEPRIELIQAAVTLEEPGLLRFHATADAVSTSDPASYEKWKDHAAFTGDFWAATITLDDVLEHFGPFDFVDIDSEGSSVDILERLWWNFEKNPPPACVCVEHDGMIDKVQKMASQVGYRELYFNGTNLVFGR